MSDQLPDEDVLTLPDEWRRSLHPRRGGAPVPEVRVDPKAPRAAERLIAKSDGVVEATLEGGDPAVEVADAVRRHLDGTPDAAGAAAVAALVEEALPDAKPPVWRVFADAWTAEHGPGFAGCALLERARTVVQRKRGGEWRGLFTVTAFRDGGDSDRTDLFALRRVRTMLATADDAEHERLDRHRSTPVTRVLAAYLVPNRRDWVDDAVGEGGSRRGTDLTLYAAADPAHLAGAYFSWDEATRTTLGTLLDGVGPAVLPFLLENLDRSHLEPRDRENIFQAIALLPSDAALDALLDRRADKYARRALPDAMRRFPVRAMRLLAARGAEAESLLADHVRVHVEAAAAALPGLPDDVRAVVEPLTEASARVSDAPADAVPAVLVSLPWAEPLRTIVVDVAARPVRTRWPDGVRDAWLGTDTTAVVPPADPDWAALAEEHWPHGHATQQKRQLVLYGPEDVVRPLLAHGVWLGMGGDWQKAAVARYEEDALEQVLRYAESGHHLGLLLPFLSGRVAEIMCAGLARTDTAPAARGWLDHHGVDAVPYIAVRALGKAKKKRQDAERTLRRLAAEHGPDAVAAACPEAADELREILTAHPVRTGLAERPEPGDWADPAVLPQVLLEDGRGALPATATRNLIELAALCDVPDGLDPSSLAEFGRSLFRRWQDAGAPAKDAWALAQLGRTGDDETVRMLTPVIRAWPGEGGHRHAVAGLDVLAGIGTDLALSYLHSIAQKVKFKGLRQRAQEKVQEVADGLGLSPDRLADRLVPSFGLAGDGSMTLDYGPRRFTVGFDEQLRPYVLDESGSLRKALPKPGAKDDPELGPAAHKAFTTLKKDVRGVASDVLTRFERALVSGRSWAAAEFREYVVGHPLVGHVARRLVWLTGDGSAFRVAEDGTFADADDEAFGLPEGARVGLAHPVHLGESRKAWAEVFADYEILQPFEQLARPVHAFAPGERGGRRLDRFEGLEAPLGNVLALVRRGWERGAPLDAGVERWISRKLADGCHIVIALWPGISVGAVDATGDHQTLETVWLASRPNDYGRVSEASRTFGDLDPVTASEVLADLETLAGAAAP